MINNQKYIEKMRQIHRKFLDFLESGYDLDNEFQSIIKILFDERIQSNMHEFKSFLHLIVKVSNNHYRTYNFFNKIEKIIISFKKEMQSYFTNNEIFNLFKSNK